MTIARLALLAFATLSLALAGTAHAQREPYGGYGAQRGGQQQKNIAGEFDYYSLVLSWSPTYCADEGQNRRDPQCDRSRSRPYAFVLHGLWPQYERGFPENCQTRERPFVPNNVISSMMDIMPSRGLIIHEYKKHGTCSGLSPEQYYAVSRRLYSKVVLPPRFQSADKPSTISPREVINAFVAANPGLKPEIMGVVCKRGSGNPLREVRICLTKTGAFRDCGSNEAQRRLCAADRLYVPAAR